MLVTFNQGERGLPLPRIIAARLSHSSASALHNATVISLGEWEVWRGAGLSLSMVGACYLIPSRMLMGGCLSSCSVAGTVDTMHFFFY